MRYILILSLLLSACAGSELLDVPIETDDNARGVSFYKPDDWDPYPYDQYVAGGGTHVRLPVITKDEAPYREDARFWVNIPNTTNKALCVPHLGGAYLSMHDENAVLAWPSLYIVKNDLSYFVDDGIIEDINYRPKLAREATTRINSGHKLKVYLHRDVIGLNTPTGDYMAYFHIFVPYCTGLRRARMFYEYPDEVLTGAPYHMLHPEKKWKVPPIEYIKHIDGDDVTPFNTPGILFTTRYPIRIEGKD